MQRVLLVLLAGLAAGFLCLGVGGRLLMRVIAYTTGESASFTTSGTLRIITLGTAWGAATALPLLWIHRVKRLSGDGGGVALGLGSFAVAVVVLFGVLIRLGVTSLPINLVLLGLAGFGALFVAYGTLAHRLASTWGGYARHNPRANK